MCAVDGVIRREDQGGCGMRRAHFQREPERLLVCLRGDEIVYSKLFKPVKIGTQIYHSNEHHRKLMNYNYQ